MWRNLLWKPPKPSDTTRPDRFPSLPERPVHPNRALSFNLHCRAVAFYRRLPWGKRPGEGPRSPAFLSPHVPLTFLFSTLESGIPGRFGILLHVRNFCGTIGLVVPFWLTVALPFAPAGVSFEETHLASPTNSHAPPPARGVPQQVVPSSPSPALPRTGLNLVILDPAHGGVDLGARGTEGIRESDLVLQFAAAAKHALEAQGFQVIPTREGNENPSFDERSARANAQRGAVFISLHVGSTGLAGTVRTYVMPDLPPPKDTTGLIPWDRAQAPYVGLSHKLGDLVQGELAKRFKGSPATAQAAPVRQLRTTAAPAIAVEISSVSVEDQKELDRMVPGVADAIARAVVAFRPSYVVPLATASPAGVQP